MNLRAAGNTLRVPTKGIDDPTAEEQSSKSYYIYALVDPRALAETGDELLSVFYVGKGTQDRLRRHEKDVLADLKQTEKELRERRSSKAQRIRQILERGVRHLDPDGLWDYYPQLQRWGIPLGDPDPSSPPPRGGPPRQEHRPGSSRP